MCGPYRTSTEPSARFVPPLELRKSSRLRSPWKYIVRSLDMLANASRTVILIPETLGVDPVVASEHTPKMANTQRPTAKSDLCKGVTPGRGRRRITGRLFCLFRRYNNYFSTLPLRSE